MFTRINRMLLRLFALPLVLVLAALALLWFFGLLVPDMLDSKILAGLGEQSAELALPVFLIAIGGAVLIALYQGLQLWRWHQGKTDVCHNCGGMVAMRNGRYGPYVRCLACGKKRSDR